MTNSVQPPMRTRRRSYFSGSFAAPLEGGLVEDGDRDEVTALPAGKRGKRHGHVGHAVEDAVAELVDRGVPSPCAG